LGVLHIIAGAGEIGAGLLEDGFGAIVSGPLGASEIMKGGGFIAGGVAAGVTIVSTHC